MLRKLYIKIMQLLGKHVYSTDCWCKPEVRNYYPEREN